MALRMISGDSRAEWMQVIFAVPIIYKLGSVRAVDDQFHVGVLQCDDVVQEQQALQAGGLIILRPIRLVMFSAEHQQGGVRGGRLSQRGCGYEKQDYSMNRAHIFTFC